MFVRQEQEHEYVVGEKVMVINFGWSDIITLMYVVRVTKTQVVIASTPVQAKAKSAVKSKSKKAKAKSVVKSKSKKAKAKSAVKSKSKKAKAKSVAA